MVCFSSFILLSSCEYLYMAGTIFNKLEKLNPPPFVTVKLKQNKLSVSLRSVLKAGRVQKWPLIKYSKVSIVLQKELELLDGFIGRKATQLKLEKAQLLTAQISKVGHRWTNNQFFKEIKIFQDAVATPSSQNFQRLPSRQWAYWIVYLALREIAILAKIKNECEKTVKFWLGLISSSHHWGDSLVVTAILSRIWHVSSVLVEELDAVVYPGVFSLCQNLQPNDAPCWPTEDFIAPTNLKLWLIETFGIVFQPANISRAFSVVAQGSKTELDSVLGKLFDESSETEPTLTGSSVIQTEPVSLNIDDEDEDVGTVVVLKTKKEKRKTKLKRTKAVKRNKNTSLNVDEDISASNPPTWKIIKDYWIKFLRNYDTHLASGCGRKKLLIRIKKHLQQEYAYTDQDSKVRIKLRRIRKSLRACSDNEYEDAEVLIRKFQVFIRKQVKRLKSDINLLL